MFSSLFLYIALNAELHLFFDITSNKIGIYIFPNCSLGCTMQIDNFATMMHSFAVI